uniref:Uncharacterized protein LOC108041343 n=1 Tax=Drosophila rhopaloa TaxID=1041015 RepID=A0A6P4EDZ7_DRORH
MQIFCTIGGFMCKFVPFITTTSVLSGSLTLVAIALDRYLAVMRPVLGFWNPDIRFSCMSMLLIWACSIGSSGPLLGIYEYKEIFLLEESDTSENSEEITAAVPEELVVTELEMAHMCVAGDHDVGLYYVILFTLIFLPCIVSFLWLNATIARQLWLRRHFHQEQQSVRVSFWLRTLTRHTFGPELEMALLHYTFDQLERYLEWALAEHGEVTPTSTALFPKYPPYPGVFVEDLSQLNRFKRNSFTAVVGTLFLLAFTGNLCALVVNSRRKLRPFFRACLISLACSDLASTVFCTVSYMAQFHGKYLQLWWVFLIMRLFGSYSEPIDWLLYFSFGILNLFSCALNPIFYTFLTQTIRTVSLVKQKVRGFFGCASGEVQESMPTDHVDKSRCCCGLRPPTFKWICHPARNMAAPTGIRDAEQPDPHSDQVQPDPSSLRRFLSFNREVFTIYKQCDDSSSASIESSA